MQMDRRQFLTTLSALPALRTATAAQTPARHVVLISIDGMAACQLLDDQLEIPNIRELIRTGVWAESSETVFPSVTHPLAYQHVDGCASAASRCSRQQPGQPRNGRRIPHHKQAPPRERSRADNLRRRETARPDNRLLLLARNARGSFRRFQPAGGLRRRRKGGHRRRPAFPARRAPPGRRARSIIISIGTRPRARTPET